MWRPRPTSWPDSAIPWSLNLTGEAGYIVAPLAGLVVANARPALADWMKEAIRPELYIKTAIVLLGAALGVKSAEALGLASAVMFRGLCAIVEAYSSTGRSCDFVARRYFGFSREWAAPLASGISICGVSAAIATGAAIRARPVVPIMVSSLVVIFAVIELLVLPFAAQHFLYDDPLVAGAWMGLAVKTDGAAVASGTIADSLIQAKALATLGVQYREGWITMTATTVKVFIDVFIGIWSFILAVIWCTKIEKTSESVRPGEIWERFPKFVLGYVLTFAGLLAFCLAAPAELNAAKAVIAGTDTFRVLFFVLTVLLHRRGLQLPKALGRRHRTTRSRLRRLPVRLHHLDWTVDLVVVLPRRQAARGKLRHETSGHRLSGHRGPGNGRRRQTR